MKKFTCHTALVLLFICHGSIFADTAYVTDQLRAGLHAEKMIGSPIVKVVPTGTPLEVITAEDRFSFVRDPEGAEGWIDNEYLIANRPGRGRLQEAETRIKDLETSLAKARQLSSAAGTAENTTISQLEADKRALEQQFKSERARTGELQVQIAELRKRLGQGGSQDELYEKIDKLNMENKQLEIRLARALDGIYPEQGRSVVPGSVADSFLSTRNILIAIAAVLLIGIIFGLYLMDFIYRRRHGGFRI